MRGVQRAAWIVLASGALGAAGVALIVWPRLFDSTPAGVGRLAGARCETAPEVEVRGPGPAIGPGRLSLEASAVGADRVVLDFELSPYGGPAESLAARSQCGGPDGDVLRAVANRLAGGRDQGGGGRAQAPGAADGRPRSATAPGGPRAHIRVRRIGEPLRRGRGFFAPRPASPGMPAGFSASFRIGGSTTVSSPARASAWRGSVRSPPSGSRGPGSGSLRPSRSC